MNRKTALIIISVAILLVVAGLIVFFIWFRVPAVPPPRGGEFPGTGPNVFPSEATTTPTVLTDAPLPRLIKLSTEPVAGAVLGVESGDASVRYVERALGRVYKVNPALPTPVRLTITTIPKIYEALWQKNGSGVVLRYLKDDNETIETYFGAIKKAGAGEGSDLQGTYLPSNIKNAVLSPDGAELMYLREEGGSGVIYATRLGSASRRELFRSPLREWALSWPQRGRAYAVTKPSVAASGLLASLTPDTGRFEMLLSGRPGLMAHPSAGSRILLAESAGSSVNLTVFNTETRTETQAPFRTLPEKCVWSPKKNSVVYCGVPKSLPNIAYPDAWYQGIAGFEDELWKADLDTGNVERISDLTSEAATPFDLVDPKISDDERYLIFTNKEDSLLWSYRLAD
jgi:hypothetical protein